jgi:hypothetical protein
MAERRWVPGWEGKYQITDGGDVISVARKHHPVERTLKLRRRKGGIPQVLLKDGRVGRVQALNIARTVLQVFGGPPPRWDSEAVHKDGDGANNRLDNLFWGFRSDVVRISRQRGVQPAGRALRRSA